MVTLTERYKWQYEQYYYVIDYVNEKDYSERVSWFVYPWTSEPAGWQTERDANEIMRKLRATDGCLNTALEVARNHGR